MCVWMFVSEDFYMKLDCVFCLFLSVFVHGFIFVYLFGVLFCVFKNLSVSL